MLLPHISSGLDGNQNQPHGNYNKEDEFTSDSDHRQVLRTFSPATHHGVCSRKGTTQPSKGFCHWFCSSIVLTRRPCSNNREITWSFKLELACLSPLMLLQRENSTLAAVKGVDLCGDFRAWFQMIEGWSLGHWCSWPEHLICNGQVLTVGC